MTKFLFFAQFRDETDVCFAAVAFFRREMGKYFVANASFPRPPSSLHDSVLSVSSEERPKLHSLCFHEGGGHHSTSTPPPSPPKKCQSASILLLLLLLRAKSARAFGGEADMLLYSAKL